MYIYIYIYIAGFILYPYGKFIYPAPMLGQVDWHIGPYVNHIWPILGPGGLVSPNVPNGPMGHIGPNGWAHWAHWAQWAHGGSSAGRQLAGQLVNPPGPIWGQIGNKSKIETAIWKFLY